MMKKEGDNIPSFCYYIRQANDLSAVKPVYYRMV